MKEMKALSKNITVSTGTMPPRLVRMQKFPMQILLVYMMHLLDNLYENVTFLESGGAFLNCNRISSGVDVSTARMWKHF